ncbi:MULTISPECIES: hypothetical protein [Kitasatospora]|uniref:Uncharacterized protein n=1 Tax=Kitasatospora setae (strain ATCC 33774 / DSM 43861 / JCM 3304 / KCC A-0304 / NBRC 14216 / KM-6054) TaxID=452652 RepID=E4N6T3_KITSK|nr:MULTISPECIES: hypothetical protein [Kitasatospora]BAJ26914.1 hypothetical protein KSE_10800 [Kitasatospora setae KM-6054]
MSGWRIWLQDQPAHTLVEISKADGDLFALVNAVLVLLDDRAGTPVDEWGDLRSVVLAPTVTAELFVDPDERTIDVLRLVWLPA